MLKNLMEENRLDLDAPLLSVRRFASEPESEPNARRSALPFYKSDLKSGPIRDPGVVPFVWEQSPGHPKQNPRLDRPSAAPKLPPGRILVRKEPDNPLVAETEKKLVEIEDEKEIHDEEEEERFSDALETLSCTESVFMNCSVSGLSEMQEASGSFSRDPQVRDFMMGRFLPAAKAMATGSQHSSSRRPQVQAREPTRMVESGDQRRVRCPLNYQYGPSFVQEEDDDDEDCYDDGLFKSKACGLIPKFCLKSSFYLLNPVPGMKVSGQRLRPTSVRRVRGPQIKAMPHDGWSLGLAEEEYSWEAVYKHKLIHGHPPPQGEDVSKLTSESNHLTYSSDSLTADGSSPQRHSNNSGISPYRNEPSQSPFHEGKSFLGVPKRDRKCSKTDGSDSFEKDSKNNLLITPHNSSHCGSGFMSPAVERALHVDTIHMPETSISRSSSLDISSNNKGIIRSANEDSEVGLPSQRIDENLDLETHDRDALQSKVTEIDDAGPTAFPEISACGAMDENSGSKANDGDDSPLSLRENNQVKNDPDPMSSLLPPPLPNSPSESWLIRTLPSVSSKNPSAQSFLGMHVQPRKQAFTSSLIVPKKEILVKPSKVQCGPTRLADMLAKPLSPQSDI